MLPHGTSLKFSVNIYSHWVINNTILLKPDFRLLFITKPAVSNNNGEIRSQRSSKPVFFDPYRTKVLCVHFGRVAVNVDHFIFQQSWESCQAMKNMMIWYGKGENCQRNTLRLFQGDTFGGIVTTATGERKLSRFRQRSPVDYSPYFRSTIFGLDVVEEEKKNPCQIFSTAIEHRTGKSQWLTLKQTVATWK